ncbi:hypothetical protein NJC38_05880 [Pseudomonas sp. 21LCFQ010]|uniref:hypothetical protein n=1 Tax=Pseudomonas sp. 21LCFQ010 TaxID=2957506 RepID=UPI002097E4EE|nr:hypothetical protein [Pseudomonas sp. 21LCFQ010]MCO8161682.1 hypothetical protein [Pseudomonas sp. 21LCFQ010]
MNLSEDFSISWVAPIVPSKSLAGIKLDTDYKSFSIILEKYSIGDGESAYRFEKSPILRLDSNDLDREGNGGYSFSLFHDEMVSKNKKGVPALSVMFKNWKIYAIKAYDFSFPGEPAQKLIYKGTFPSGAGLGSFVSDLLPFSDLEFDEGEEWFYTDEKYGAVEITGWSAPLEDQPNQLITAICVI